MILLWMGNKEKKSRNDTVSEAGASSPMTDSFFNYGEIKHPEHSLEKMRS